MASEFALNTVTKVTPRLRIGYRVSVGARCLAKRSTPGLIGIEIRRGDGGNPETYPTTVASLLYGPLLADEEIRLTLGAIDLLDAGDLPRSYLLRVVAVGGVDDLEVRDVNIATSPYSEPGLLPP